MNCRQWHLICSVLAFGIFTSPLLASDYSQQEVQKLRHIELEGQANFRDIGGYKTIDNQSVKWNILYRSGELPRLSDKDLTKLDSLEITTVVNFLTNDEINARGQDRLPEGVNELFFPISGEAENNLAKVVLEARQTADFSNVPVELNTEVHRLLVGDAAREQYANLIRVASDPENHPLVFHCSHGVHRTGTATAILLAALGVPWETIRNDYLLSNTYRKEEVEKRISELQNMAAEKQGIPPSKVDMTNINAFYILEASYIEASLDEIHKTYGSMENYLHKGLGLKDKDVEELRNALLE
ncbi:tyrosine-protein phosphatase [Agaribacterium sp. ZY112]|uniref:tyrosine-protein phosphatase n=1 Tax=Agaribacterium sp. ZY112 TaxID=3233574 RepID=UPI0035257704